MSAKFYICDTDEQNFIFGIIVSARLNLDFELARDRLREYFVAR